MRRFVVFVLIASLGACAARTVVEDPEVTAQIGFLNGPEINRTIVEARLGVPAVTYEGGAVVSYALYVEDDRLTPTRTKSWGPEYALLVQYDADGRLVRYTLLRRR